MTKYIFLVYMSNDRHLHIVVTRLADGLQKYFFQAYGSVDGITRFMNSMTDDLIESYFPRVDKKGKTVGGFDNWIYLGDNPDRLVAEEKAREDLTAHRLTYKIQT